MCMPVGGWYCGNIQLFLAVDPISTGLRYLAVDPISSGLRHSQHNALDIYVMIMSNHECMTHANMHYIAIHSYRVNCVSIITFFTKDPHYTIDTHIPELLIRFSFPLFNESSTSLLAWPGGRK